MTNPRIYTEAELHLMPFCFGPRERVTYTEAEVERWLLLRAIEWEAWPEFVSQLLIPIALLRFPVLPVLVVLALVDLSWRFVVTHWISMTLVRIGPIVTFLKWPSAIACACVLAYSHRFGVAVLALVWPLVGAVFITALSDLLSKRLGLCGIGDVERALAARIGYPACRPLRIVCLDDEPFMGYILKMIIGFDFPDSVVLTHTDAELAWQELEREDPDLFITDWNHPGRLHGGGLLQDLANKGVRYPVVVASAMGECIVSQKILDPFINQGLNVTLLLKPFSADDLREHLSVCLDRGYASPDLNVPQEKSPLVNTPAETLDSNASATPIYESKNAANGSDSNAPRKLNYFIRHWRGDLSLGVSYWLNGILGSVLVLLLQSILSSFNETAGLKAICAGVILVYLVSLLAWVWQVVGVWRSASNHVTRGGKPVWATLAKAVTCFSILHLYQFTVNTVAPQSMELASVVLGDSRVPAYKITVLPGGDEVEFQGGIRAGSAKEVERILNAVPQAKVLRINSVGGRIGEAERMAKLVRERGMDTYASEECLSAATLVFIAGKERRVAVGAKVGFHQGSIAGITDDQRRSVNESNRHAMRAAGISDEFIDRALATPPDSMWYPSFDEMRNGGVITKSPLQFTEDDIKTSSTSAKTSAMEATDSSSRDKPKFGYMTKDGFVELTPAEYVELGSRYYYGDGVSQDYKEAAKCFRKAAEQDNAKAQYNLGSCYAMGQGVEQDDVEAARWNRKSAENGYAIAQYLMGVIYRNGNGVSLDYSEGVKWLRRAADQGVADAQIELARCYGSGQGVTRDYVQADKWLNLAIAQAKPADFLKCNGMVSGATARQPLVIINGVSIERGRRGLIKTPVGPVSVTCAKIEGSEAQILVEGESKARTLNRSKSQSPGPFQDAFNLRESLEELMTREQIAESQRRASTFVMKKERVETNDGAIATGR